MVILRHVLEALLNPFLLILFLFILILLLFFLKGDNVIIRGGLLLILLFQLLFSTGWLVESITRKLEDQYAPIKVADETVHWVIVLSGGQAKLTTLPANSLLYNASIKRLVEGLRLYRQLPSAKLLLSGGGYGFEIPEATHLAELAAWFAVPKKDILLETQSINTADQIKAIKQLVRDDTFYLVTSAIHMPRAIALCKTQGLHPIAAPTDFTLYWDDARWTKTLLPNPYNLYYLSVAMHEILGQMWLKLNLNSARG